MSERLRISNLSKSFQAPVLKNIDLELQAGEVLGLVGENGAGKSTLMNIICGLIDPDIGEMHIDQVNYRPRNNRDAFNSGVSLAAQELSLVDNLSIAENISLRSLPGFAGLINRQVLVEAFEKWAGMLELGELDPNAAVSSLSLGEKQLVELAKALSTSSRILILDEPTAALTEAKTRLLHGIIRQQAGNGASIIYISHRLDDVLDIADRTAIMKDGELIKVKQANELDTRTIISFMSGAQAIDEDPGETKQRSAGKKVSVNKLTTARLQDAISFDCAAGEILGIAGLAGAGQDDILRALFGLDKSTSGEISVKVNSEWQHIRSTTSALGAGIGYLPEDRKKSGIFPGQSVSLNMTVPGLSRHRTRQGLIDSKSVNREVESYLDKLAIRCRGPQQHIEQLSGGNQQKVIISRLLHNGTEIFLLNEPTRGVDVGTKVFIHKLLKQLAGEGKSIIMVSSEFSELTSVCDRILVMSNHKPAGFFTAADWSHEVLLQAAFSAYMNTSNMAQHS